MDYAAKKERDPFYFRIKMTDMDVSPPRKRLNPLLKRPSFINRFNFDPNPAQREILKGHMIRKLSKIKSEQ
jgi:hypothetical protein